MKKDRTLFLWPALFLCQIGLILALWPTNDKRQTLVFACGYLYGQANMAEVLGRPDARWGLVPSCVSYAQRAAAGGFTEVSRALK